MIGRRSQSPYKRKAMDQNGMSTQAELQKRTEADAKERRDATEAFAKEREEAGKGLENGYADQYGIDNWRGGGTWQLALLSHPFGGTTGEIVRINRILKLSDVPYAGFIDPCNSPFSRNSPYVLIKYFCNKQSLSIIRPNP